MFHFQSHLIFPTHAVPPPGPWPPGAERLSLKTADGSELAGIHIPADHRSEEPTLILGFGGNAWNAQDVAEYLHELFPEDEVVAFHYRGYKPSTGSPSADALLTDAPLVYDAAVGQVKPKRVVAIGFSIGSGVVARLAAERKLDGLILVTPFDSLKAVAQSMYPWLPIGPIFEHEIDAATALDKLGVPVAIIAAENDEIVPAARTDALRRRAPNLVFDRTISRAGHNDIYARSSFQEAMREAANRLKL
ncbi:MAG TPA: alpha/beta fold hydrolase [Sphingomicrobium sp.]|nr:alpha/beta fold hydrolase [Sphingomicrobium sp.]